VSSADLRGYALAIFTTAAAVALTRLTWPLFAGAPFAPLFGAVATTTQWGTWRASLLAIALCSASAHYAFPATWNPASLAVFIPIALFATYVITSRIRAVTALRAREAELRATIAAQRQAALDLQVSEQKLRHAHKMEAIGQLVAGVAHNFNNLLTVTLGYSELLMDRHPTGDPDREPIDEIRKATDRGASLTRQLLALGHKHDARRERLDLNRRVTELREMLRRVIREDIALTIDGPGTSIAVVSDRNDLEQIILNLVLNARDALPSGGEIQIDVSQVQIDATNVPADVSAEPGTYARLRVRDDGTGMTPEAQAHLFEPFFTTKEVGEGTGLSLPFVHGIARQTGGFVTIDTLPGKGTTVSVYFPYAGDAPVEAPAPPPAPPVQATDHRATILLVEDEAVVRNLAARALTRAGYRVLSAAAPGEALRLFEQHTREVALLLTDVVMPEMHGPALARRLGAVRPELPVLFMSGYSDAIPADSAGTERAAFLAKPFAPADLIRAVAELLASGDPAGR
jgi:signal transduction histidine kinase/ActR/RegA family two-component response regulator